MLLRLSLIIAIVASLATAGISFIKVKEKITNLMAERDKERTDKETAQRERDQTKTELTKTKKDLDKTKADLVETTSQRDQALTDAANQTKRASELTDKLAKTTEERDNFDRELSQYKVIGTVDQVSAAIKDAKDMRLDRTNLVKQIVRLTQQLTDTTNALYQLTGGEEIQVPLPATLRGKVVVVDPKYDFVILDIGGDQGALQNGVLLVNRNGKLVAKLKIRNVQPNRSIANVMPGWKLGEVMEGDAVLPGI